MAHRTYDLIVIGSGPAGQKCALNSAKLGKRVALIDRESCVGGVCIHTGTIPSKAMREAVLHLTGLRERSLYGEGYTVKRRITMEDLLYRAQHVVRTEVDVIRNQMGRNGVDMFFGDASFIDPNRIHIEHDDESIELQGAHILVAVGTEPARPANVPFMKGRIIDSNELLALQKLPKSMIIVGGGVIGIEYACMLSDVGVKITLIESRPRVLEFLDDEISESLQFRMRDMGIRLRLGESVQQIERSETEATATLASNKKIRAELLLYSVGRQGATARLNLSATGLEPDNRGRLKVNEYYQTNIAHIYAAGDVIGFPALAATSMEQGRLASAHMFGQIADSASPLFPFGIYTIP